MNLKRTVINKITSQWKTIRKAFKDINQDVKTPGYLSKDEFKA